MFWVYVLQNSKGVLYKGYTSDLERRIQQHNSGDGFQSYTRGKGPWILIHKEEFATKKEAENREKFFKTGKGREFLKSIIGRLSA